VTVRGMVAALTDWPVYQLVVTQPEKPLRIGGKRGPNHQPLRTGGKGRPNHQFRGSEVSVD